VFDPRDPDQQKLRLLDDVETAQSVAEECGGFIASCLEAHGYATTHHAISASPRGVTDIVARVPAFDFLITVRASWRD
jgi:hypothetical protein